VIIFSISGIAIWCFISVLLLAHTDCTHISIEIIYYFFNPGKNEGKNYNNTKKLNSLNIWAVVKNKTVMWQNRIETTKQNRNPLKHERSFSVIANTGDCLTQVGQKLACVIVYCYCVSVSASVILTAGCPQTVYGWMRIKHSLYG